MSTPVLRIEGLRTEYGSRGTTAVAVDGVSMNIGAGEIVGLVGESGCGKTTLGLSILRLVPEPGRIVAGSIELEGRDVLNLDDAELRRVRGQNVGLSFQDPTTALNPLMTVGRQLQEVLTAQGRQSTREARRRVVPLMGSVSIPAPVQRSRDYPHQFSGGMRQRIMVAMGIANSPSLLVADEPTTGLDVTIQAQIVDLLRERSRASGTALLLITHDMALVANLCHRVVVMYAGRIIEEGRVDDIFERPQHPYTWSLLRAVPGASSLARLEGIPGIPPDLANPPPACRFEPRCAFSEERCKEKEPPLAEVHPGLRTRCWVLMRNVEEASLTARRDSARCLSSSPASEGRLAEPSSQFGDELLLRVDDLHKHFPAGHGGSPIRAVDGVSFEIRRGETLGLVGESGCGKSTLARVILKLLPITSGRVFLQGQDLTTLKGRKLRQARREAQIIFQDPFSSLDGRMSVGRTIAEPLENFGMARGEDLRQRVAHLLELVGLSPDLADRYPHEFSGGQRQRIGIARALALRPSLIVCDEPVSSLDVSIQAQIINLLSDLQQKFGLSYLFISHDLSVVRHLSDRVAVMYLGKIVEAGSSDRLFEDPQHPYTKILLDSAPVPAARQVCRGPRAMPEGEVPSSANPPSGCRFHTRCPIARVPGRCSDEEPLLESRGVPSVYSACHFAGEPILASGQIDTERPSSRMKRATVCVASADGPTSQHKQHDTRTPEDG